MSRGGKILLVRRRVEPGVWMLPGGIVEYGERAEEAARREVKEETNVDVAVKRLVGVYNLIRKKRGAHYVVICYDAKYTGGTIKASEEIEEAAWFKPDEIPRLHTLEITVMALRDAGYIP